MARPGYDSPAGRAFHGLAGDTPLFESPYLRVDQMDNGDAFVEVTRMGDTTRVYRPVSELIAMAKAILERLGER